jgi:hypothetical protein
MKLVWIVDFGNNCGYGLFIVIQNILYAIIYLNRIPKKKINPQKYINNGRYNIYKGSTNFWVLLTSSLNKAKTVEEAERIVREFEWRKIIYFYSL